MEKDQDNKESTPDPPNPLFPAIQLFSMLESLGIPFPSSFLSMQIKILLADRDCWSLSAGSDKS